MGKPEMAMRPGKPTLVAPAATAEERAVDLSFAAYVATRPDPLDAVERILLRLSWLAWRVTHRPTPPVRERPRR
jgi:hypothetical protein